MSNEQDYAVLRDPEMKEIFESFLVETREILEQLDLDLVELEKEPDDAELLNKIFRAFHTVKGTSGFLGLTRLMELTHNAEDLLNKLRKGELKLNSYIMDGILQAYDSMKALVDVIESELNEDFDITGVVSFLTQILENKGIEHPAAAPAEAAPVAKAQEEAAPVEATETSEDEEVDPENAEFETVSVGPAAVTVPAQSIVESNKTAEAAAGDGGKASRQALKDARHDAPKGENTIRVDVQRLDDLLNLVSELVLGRNRLAQVYTEASMTYEGTPLVRDLSDASRQIDLMTTELQLAVMKTRMIKIGKVFNKFPRVVRDLAKETGKEVELLIHGEDTELDKTLIEEINDPLVHLVRNSIDHGVESPEKRVAAGKPRIGKVMLYAEHEGNNIIIMIEDDGAGIDSVKICEKAISKGLITRDRAKELSQPDIYNLLFLPGFSTAEKVTNISGRGVGLDVVKTNVSKLRGVINIESEPGRGTKFIIKLPLTLAIIQGLLVSIGKETVVIPLNSVIEVIRLHKKQIYSIKGKEVIKLRNEVLPLFDVGKILYRYGNHKEENLWQYIVIVGVAEKKFGVKVDFLIGQKEVVIKSLGSYLGTIKGIAGSTIMGDGKVVMILDLAEILHQIS